MQDSKLEPTQREFLEGLAKPLLELYGFRRINAVTKKTVDAIKIKDIDYADGTSAPMQIKIDSRFFWGIPSSATIGLILHEISHQRKLGMVDLATANAFSYYFDTLEGMWEHNSALMHLMDFSKEPEVLQELEAALQRKNYLSTLKKLRAKYPHLSKQEFAIMVEHNGSEIHKSYKSVGALLAHVALIVEIQKKKPGVGLFLIRDVSLGKSVASSMAKIFRGDYERARKSILQRYPVLREGIMRTMYYQKKLHVGVRRRAANLKRFHPEEVKRARFMSSKR